MRKCAKTWESEQKVEKVWKNVLKVEKSWESVLKVEKVCQKLRKCAKSWQSVWKVEQVIENAPEVKFSWKSVLPAQIQLFSTQTIGRLLFDHILKVTLGKIHFGFFLCQTQLFYVHTINWILLSKFWKLHSKKTYWAF